MQEPIYYSYTDKWGKLAKKTEITPFTLSESPKTFHEM